jgi:cytochrome c553
VPGLPRHQRRGHHCRLSNSPGQHVDYLERALLDYQKGARKNAIMAPMVQTLTKEDIEALAKYYSGQKPSLETVQRKSFFFSSN